MLFAMAIFAGAVFAYLPGCLALRAFRLPLAFIVAGAPLVDIALYSLMGILYGKMDVPASWETMFLPLLGAGLALFAGRLIFDRKERLSRGAHGVSRAPQGGFLKDAALLALYLAIGVVALAAVFIGNMDSTDWFLQEFDNGHHLGAIRTFAESGVWSSLETSMYLQPSDIALDPQPGSGFYPSAWHTVAAFMVDLTGVTVAQAANATNFLFSGIVFATSSFAFMKVLFPNSNGMVAIGAPLTFAFAAFPWKLLYWGPLFPNLASFGLVPAVMTFFILVFCKGCDASERIRSAALFVIGMVALVFAQTNGVFTVAVLLVPYCVYAIVRVVASSSRFATRRLFWQILFSGIFLLFALVAWSVLYKLPFMQAVVTFNWPAFAGKAESTLNFFTLSFRETEPQYLLGAMVVVGMVWAVAKRNHAHVWLAFSWLIAGGLYVLSASTDGWLKQFLTGFWYTDCMRLGANVVLVAIPLAALGVQAVGAAVATVFRSLEQRRDVRAPLAAGGEIAVDLHPSARSAQAERRPLGGMKRPYALVSGVLVALFIAVLFLPNFSLPDGSVVRTPLGETGAKIGKFYDTDRANVLDEEEAAFVERVMGAVPEGSVILNQPNDGSVFAYGTKGIDVYYRYMAGYGGEGETPESVAIRTGLSSVTENEGVREALDVIGADYLMQLDNQAYAGQSAYDPYYLWSYYYWQWEGFDAVNDETPGFEIVLADGDMRLYRIVA